MLINRNLYLQRLVSRMHNGMVKVITGIRRSGKSFLLFEIFRQYLLDHGVSADHILGLQLDRFENRRYRDPEELLAFMNAQIVDDGRYYILLDEVQMLDHFSEVLNSFLYRKNVDLYVTGSNSKFLSTDVLTEFKGRGDEVHIFPLSFSEFTFSSFFIFSPLSSVIISILLNYVWKFKCNFSKTSAAKIIN